MLEDRLYSIAIQCARWADQGCNKACEQCQYNVFNYVSDVREASLLKANAYTDYYNSMEAQKAVEDAHNIQIITPLIMIGLTVLGFIWLVSRCTL